MSSWNYSSNCNPFSKVLFIIHPSIVTECAASCTNINSVGQVKKFSISVSMAPFFFFPPVQHWRTHQNFYFLSNRQDGQYLLSEAESHHLDYNSSAISLKIQSHSENSKSTCQNLNTKMTLTWHGVINRASWDC